MTVPSIRKTSVIDKLMAFLAVPALLFVTYWMWSNAVGDATRAARERFDFKVGEARFAIDQRLLAYEHVLRGAVGLFAASDEVRRDEWRTYVRQLDIDKYYPGIQGIGFSLRIPPGRKAGHLAAIRAEGFPNYSIRPERPEYTSIVFLEPFDWRNQRAFGYDMFSEPVRRLAMERARDAGLPSVSGKVTLVQETEKGVQYGFLMYLPVYSGGEIPPTMAERRTALLGYVYISPRSKPGRRNWRFPDSISPPCSNRPLPWCGSGRSATASPWLLKSPPGWAVSWGTSARSSRSCSISCSVFTVVLPERP